MERKKVAKLVGFTGALCATAALVSFTVSSTGAYFTDSNPGSIRATSGHLSIDTSDTNLNFANLMPGEDQTLPVNYTTNVSSGNVDVWLVFDGNSKAYGEFTGQKSHSYEGYTDGGMGRYGHFKVAADGHTRFQSYNLQLAADPSTGCPVNPDTGNGGSSQQSTSAADTPPECGVPSAIRLAAGLPNDSHGQIQITFGLTGRQTQQGQAEFPNSSGQLPFKVVATQAGHGPNDANF